MELMVRNEKEKLAWLEACDREESDVRALKQIQFGELIITWTENSENKPIISQPDVVE